MSRILRINTRTREYRLEDMGPYAGLGGRALTSRLVNKEVPATCHPLSADNKLVVATGILSGTRAASSGRTSVGGKSPLTLGIKEANAGGQFAQKLAKLDIMAVVLEDKPEDDAAPCIISITKDGIAFHDASKFQYSRTYATAEALQQQFGDKSAAMIIGPAGETMRLGASIQFTDTKYRPARAAGRGGLGAVMGSKKVKAIVLDDTGAPGVTYADDEAFKTAGKRWADILRGHAITGQGLPAYGTAILINVINEAGALPTKNFREGRFQWAPDVSGEKMSELIEKRGGKVKEGCHTGCAIQCSQSYVDKDGKYITSGLEYETIWALGPNSMIKEIDEIAKLDHICDDLGLDTIEMGTTVAVAMDAGLLEWGDAKAAQALLNRVGDPKDPLGRIVGNGTAFLGEAYGVTRIPVVKRQSLPAYDPRAVKGVGVTYATTPMGADHTAGYAVCQNVLKCGGEVDPHGKAGQVETSKNLQIATAAIDSSGLCLFVAFAVLDVPDGMQTICDMITARTGQKTTPDDVVNLGIQTLKDEYDFNRRAGFSPADDQLPDFFKEKLAPHNVSWDFTVEELQAARAG